MQQYPWIIRFIKIAAKSIAEINYEYKEWNLGFSGIKDDKNRVDFLYGPGIEKTIETHVCSKIVRESIASPLFSGAIIDEDKSQNIKKGVRYWKIESEVSYCFNTQKKCDIITQRYDWDIKKWAISKTIYPKVYIEAKRANIGNLSASSKTEQQKRIIDDINKFSKEHTFLSTEKSPIPYFYLLVWGEMNDITNEGPEEYLNSLKKNYSKKLPKDSEISLAQIEWIPQKWECNNERKPTKITSAIWICLFSVKFET